MAERGQFSVEQQRQQEEEGVAEGGHSHWTIEAPRRAELITRTEHDPESGRGRNGKSLLVDDFPENEAKNKTVIGFLPRGCRRCNFSPTPVPFDHALPITFSAPLHSALELSLTLY